MDRKNIHNGCNTNKTTEQDTSDEKLNISMNGTVQISKEWKIIENEISMLLQQDIFAYEI